MPAKPFRIAKSLEKLRAQINAKFPNRNKLSDGWIGDPAHQSTSSDHNPHINEVKWRVVSALDITHDPAHGCDANKIAKSLIAKQDSRLKYVISNGMKASSYRAATVRPGLGGSTKDPTSTIIISTFPCGRRRACMIQSLPGSSDKAGLPHIASRLLELAILPRKKTITTS